MFASNIASRFSLYELSFAYHKRLETVERELKEGGFFTETNFVDTVIVATCNDTAEVYTVATALCSGSDIFSEDIGLDIALTRYQMGGTVRMKARDFDALCRSLLA